MKEKTSQKISIVESEQQFRSMFENNNSIMLLLNPMNGDIKLANPAACDFYGWTFDEMAKKKIYEINILSKEKIDIEMKRALTEKRSKFQFKHKLKSGEIRDVVVNSSLAKVQGQKLLYSIIRDITEQHKTEVDLVASEERLNRSQKMAKVGSWEIKIGEETIWASEEAYNIFEVNNQKVITVEEIENFVYEDDKNRVHEALINLIEKEEEYNLEYRIFIKKSKKIKYVHSKAECNYDKDGNPTVVLGVIRDITARIKLEKEKEETQAIIRNQQKIESIGLLASGVAHEINNPINGIMNYSQLIVDSTFDNSEIKGYADEIILETHRVSSIVRSLLQFSRQDTKYHSKARIEDIIENTLLLIRMLIKKDQIILEVNINKNLPSIDCRSQQIQQVLMNLMTNSRDALNQKYKGFNENKKLIISCEKFIKNNQDWIRTTVEDYGTGITRETQNKMYEPFFTTKTKFKGTGLGLSISYGIVAEHNGELSFNTKEAEYTRFFLDLPAVK